MKLFTIAVRQWPNSRTVYNEVLASTEEDALKVIKKVRGNRLDCLQVLFERQALEQDLRKYKPNLIYQID